MDRSPRPVALAACLAAATLAGCGSATIDELPPAAGPDRAPPSPSQPAGEITTTTPESAANATRPQRSDDLRDGTLRVVLDPRARTLKLQDARQSTTIDEVTVGVGPTQVACASGGPCYVTDTTGDALLVVRIAADGRRMRLSRRVYVAGAPYAIAVDRERRRIWVTLTGRSELVELGAHRRPHILQRLPTVRQPDGVRVDEATGEVTVIGTAPARLQQLTNPASPDRP